MEKTTSSRQHRTRFAAGSLALGLIVLVGCASTIDGRAAVGPDLIGEIGGTSSSTSSSSSSTAESESESSAGESTGSAESTSSDTAGSETPTTAPSTESTPSSSSSSASSSSSSSASSSGTASTTFSGNPDNLGLTAPGTALKFGDPALLPFAFADAEGVFTVSGLSVTKGSEADWATLGVDTSDAQGEEPWYLRMTLKQESGGDFSFTSVQDDLWAYSGEDILSTVYPNDDTNSLCPLTYAPEEFTVGGTYDACVVLSVNLGEGVDRVQFEGGYDPDDPYYENPVVWTG